MENKTNLIVVPVIEIPTTGAWCVRYENGATLSEDASAGVFWENIDWEGVAQLNIMGLIILPPFNKILFSREAVAMTGRQPTPVSIDVKIEYETNILNLRLSKIPAGV